MHALVLLYINQRTKFEVLSFIISKDIIVRQNLKKRVTWPWPRPLGGSLSSPGQHVIYSTCVPNLATLVPAVTKI